jgi:ribosomal protein S9
MVTGGGRNGQATAAVMQITRGAMNERERGDWGWAGSV